MDDQAARPTLKGLIARADELRRSLFEADELDCQHASDAEMLWRELQRFAETEDGCKLIGLHSEVLEPDGE